MAKKRVKKKVSRKTAKKISKSSKNKFSLSWKNLIFFAFLSFLSFGLYTYTDEEMFKNLFQLLSIIFGFVAVAFLITFLIFLFLRLMKKK